jgi:hypothetical protein
VVEALETTLLRGWKWVSTSLNLTRAIRMRSDFDFKEFRSPQTNDWIRRMQVSVRAPVLSTAEMKSRTQIILFEIFFLIFIATYHKSLKNQKSCLTGQLLKTL